ITAIHERARKSGVPTPLLGADALDRVFTYDPLSRLLSATGRECDAPPLAEPWDAAPRPVDATRTRAYTEQYQYDAVGNVTQLKHLANGGGFTRTLSVAADSNRLAKMTVGENVYDYAYDPNGNLIRETTSRHFEWDHSDRMRVYRTQAGDAEPSVHAQYLYDATGMRVKKLARKQGGQVEVTVYIDGIFERQRVIRNNATQENDPLHVMDDQRRIALVRAGLPFPDDATPAVKFHLSDHLGSSNVVVDDAGALVSREEYTPYGETSFGSFAKKRYRFIGKERDEESGLNYHGARYYAPWLARWISYDPLAARHVNISPYHYSGNNPLLYVDRNGKDFSLWVDEKARTITVVAAYFTTEKDAKRLKPAIDYINKQSGKFAYTVHDKVQGDIEYAINFSLSYETVSAKPDAIYPSERDGVGHSRDQYAAIIRSQEARRSEMPANSFAEMSIVSTDNKQAKEGGVTVRENESRVKNMAALLKDMPWSTSKDLERASIHEVVHTLMTFTDGNKTEHIPDSIMAPNLGPEQDKGITLAVMEGILGSAGLGKRGAESKQSQPIKDATDFPFR